MKLEEYFDLKKGVGVLSTADDEGKVDAAIYARPHFMDDGTAGIHHARPSLPPQSPVKSPCSLPVQRGWFWVQRKKTVSDQGQRRT